MKWNEEYVITFSTMPTCTVMKHDLSCFARSFSLSSPVLCCILLLEGVPAKLCTGDKHGIRVWTIFLYLFVL